MRIVVSLTTIPGRADMLRRTIQSLWRQTRRPDAIYLWLPSRFFSGDHPDYRFPGVRVQVGTDLGPAMKILPLLAIETDPDTAIIPVDDDIEYPPELIERLARTGALLPDMAIGFTGWNVNSGAAGPKVVHLNEDVPQAAMLQPVHVLEGYRGVLYRRGFFAQDVFQHLAALTAFRFHDDILLSGYLASRGITRLVRWYGTDPTPAGGRWRLHGQDIGLHTRPGWLDQGWACWNYWVRNFPAALTPLTTPDRSERLQLGADRDPREGFLHQGPPGATAPLDVAHDLGKLPWPWPSGGLREVLALDGFADQRLARIDWLGECRRILGPGGVLKLRLPMRPEGLGGDEPGLERTFVSDRHEPWLGASAWGANPSRLGCTAPDGWRFSWEQEGSHRVVTLLRVAEAKRGS